MVVANGRSFAFGLRAGTLVLHSLRSSRRWLLLRGRRRLDLFLRGSARLFGLSPRQLSGFALALLAFGSLTLFGETLLVGFAFELLFGRPARFFLAPLGFQPGLFFGAA